MKPMPYDVIIVGGGPAGSAAALFARSMAMSVLLLDKERFPRDKICGDAISGKAMTILKELSVLDEALSFPHQRMERVLFSSPGGYRMTIPLSENR
ncbi:MAG: FAD-dependent oxidoreductase [Calditrichaeota bacterium]|nr:MAG: FAD-dependent oxidoreductase [Calditrichota bacterium]